MVCIISYEYSLILNLDISYMSSLPTHSLIHTIIIIMECLQVGNGRTHYKRAARKGVGLNHEPYTKTCDLEPANKPGLVPQVNQP